MGAKKGRGYLSQKDRTLRHLRIELRWLIAWIAILAGILGLGAQFRRYLAGLPSPAGTASICLFPFVVITVLVAASPRCRRTPTVLLIWFGGEVLTTGLLAAFVSKVMWGYFVGNDWPLAFMACSFIEVVPFLIVLRGQDEHRGYVESRVSRLPSSGSELDQ